MAHYVATSTGRSLIRPPTMPADGGGLARADARRPRHRGAAHRAGDQPTGSRAGLHRHFHSFEEALYVLDGELLLEIDGAAHRLRSGDYALVPLGMPTCVAQSGRRQARWLTVHTPQRIPRGRAARHHLRLPERGPRRWIGACPPFGDPRCGTSATTTGTPPQAEALRSTIPPAAGGRRDGHRAGRLQRHLGQDARRSRLRRRAADDVHRRLRAGRLGAGPRPPVRGGLLLPRRRDRGRARRPAVHHPRR
jgi:mannose-6-phosphate isomerase-like protein (cupin superfamily)